MTPTDDPQKQLVKYYQSMVKYLTNQPKPAARQQQKQEVKEEPTKRKILDDMGKISKKDKKGTCLKDVITYDLPSDQSREAETKEKEQRKAKGGKYFRGLRQTWIGQVEI